MRGTPGSPGFKGERLREARESVGLTSVALAGMIGVTRQALSLYESGGRTPGPDVLDKLVASLGMPYEFFFRVPVHDNLGPVFYRSLAAATKTARRKAEQRFEWLYEIVVAIEEAVELPVTDLPRWKRGDPLGLTSNDIEEAASTTRKHWGISDGPVPDLCDHAERRGVVISQFVMESDDLDAFSCWPKNSPRPFVLLNAEKGSAARLRLDTAHELGHQILHHEVEPAQARRPEIHKLMEQQAFRFGSALLMEAGFFLDDVDAVSLDYLRTLKPTWGVSIGAMIFRLRDLDVIDQDECKRLWRTYTMRGFRREEPLDDKMEAERPRLLSQAVETIGGPQKLLALLRSRIVLPDRLYEELLGLPGGAMAAPTLPPKTRLRQDAGSESDNPSGGDVVPFRRNGDEDS